MQQLIFYEKWSNVAGSIETDPIGDRPLCDGRAETIRVPYDPIGHKAPITTANDMNFLGIDLWMMIKHVIHT